MLKTFKKGGVHPPENKFSAGNAIQEMALPKVVYIPVAQHIGSPSAPVVKKGDKVRVGQLISKSAGFVSANIHSPVSGTVSKVDAISDSFGYPRQGIIIQVEGDEWEEGIDRSPGLVRECLLTGPEIVQKIQEAGVVGMGGATFPTHVKLIPPKGMTAEMQIGRAHV